MSEPVDTEAFPDIGAASLAGRFATGLGYAFAGIPLTFRHFSLLRLAIIPVLLNILLFGFFVVGGLRQIGDIVHAASLGIDEQSFWHFVEVIWTYLVTLVTLVAVLLGGFFATVVVGNILAGPIYDLLSERTEVILLGRSAAEPFTVAGFLGDLGEELALMASRVALYLGGLLGIFAIGLTPAVGQVLGPILSTGWSWLFLCLELHNASLARHKVKGTDRLRHLFRHKAAHLGFGGAAWLMLWVPVMMPFLVVGATRHHLALAAWDRAPSALTLADKQTLRQGSLPATT